ncbi:MULTISPECIES: hypothetical protein [Paenibacillus]|uniref:hypothetical protein n=1 Tax=Paenibacillus TaxID=44249 RepID=UPI00096D5387|nr:hypothetical protein [Paenibacillus odorifer]OMD06454.1 hypothetical protein BJP50_11090 [Paenibacillus odorifer]
MSNTVQPVRSNNAHMLDLSLLSQIKADLIYAVFQLETENFATGQEVIGDIKSTIAKCIELEESMQEGMFSVCEKQNRPNTDTLASTR